MYLYLLIGFLVSFIICLLIIKVFRIITDNRHKGPQKIHQNPTSRAGGVAIAVSMLALTMLTFINGESYKNIYLILFVVSIPTFLAGLIEDLTAKLKVRWRMFLISISAGLAFFLINAKITSINLPVDVIFQYFFISFVFTVFAIVGVTNSINIIDGFNGLASMVSIIILLALGYVAYKLEDYFILTACFSMVGTLAGFFVFNYPRGLIFLGDGGAYLTGFYIGALSVLLVRNHPEVSAWFPFLVCIYPISETIFSIYRRKFIKRSSPTASDCLHFHSLIYKRLTRQILGKETSPMKRNAVTSLFLWLLCLVGVIPAVIFWENTYLLILFSMAFMFVYLYLYWKVLLPKIPKWAKKP